MAAAVALSSLPVHPTLLRTSNIRLQTLRRLPFIRAASSSSSPPAEFNISFGNSSPKDKDKILTLTPTNSPSSPSPQQAPLLIPWIVRDEKGNLKLQSTPPASFVHSMAEAKAAKDTKKKAKESKINDRKKKLLPLSASAGSATSSSPSSAPPKYSKAARRFYNQTIRESERLSKVLAAAGVASRRSSEELIFEGKVTVNGSVCKLPQTRVDLLKDSIYVNGNRLSKKLPPKLYFVLNKPKGYICSSGEESKSVVSLFDEYWKSWNKTNPGVPKPRLFTVGRLDVATTGLIIVTNDGDFSQRLAHPSSNITKEYIAAIEGSVHRRHLIALSEGTQIEGVQCVPDFVELLPVQPDASRPRIRIVVHEGRNHEVRELVKNAGLQLYSLKRVRIGGYRLPSDLGLGKYVELKESQLKVFGAKMQKS